MCIRALSTSVFLASNNHNNSFFDTAKNYVKIAAAVSTIFFGFLFTVNFSTTSLILTVASAAVFLLTSLCDEDSVISRGYRAHHYRAPIIHPPLFYPQAPAYAPIQRQVEVVHTYAQAPMHPPVVHAAPYYSAPAHTAAIPSIYGQDLAARAPVGRPVHFAAAPRFEERHSVSHHYPHAAPHAQFARGPENYTEENRGDPTARAVVGSRRR